MNQLSFETYEDELINPLKGHTLTEIEAYVASLLLDAKEARPRTNEELRDFVSARYHQKLTEREMKAIILSLREEHCFPILASKAPPYGYWWCESSEQMLVQLARVHSEAVGMLSVWSKIAKAHYPELAGQLRLNMEGDI